MKIFYDIKSFYLMSYKIKKINQLIKTKNIYKEVIHIISSNFPALKRAWAMDLRCDITEEESDL